MLHRWDARAYDVWLLMAILDYVLDLMEFDSRFEGSRLERPPRLYVKRAQEGLDEPEGIWGEMRDGAYDESLYAYRGVGGEYSGH